MLLEATLQINIIKGYVFMNLLFKVIFLTVFAGIFGVILGLWALLFWINGNLDLELLAKIIWGLFSISCMTVYGILFELSSKWFGFKLKFVYVAIVFITSMISIFIANDVFEYIAVDYLNTSVTKKYLINVHIMSFILGIVGAGMLLWPLLVLRAPGLDRDK